MASLRRLLVDNLREHLEKTLSPIGDEAGMHLTATLDTKHRDEEVAARAVRQKLSLWPLSRLYLSQPPPGIHPGLWRHYSERDSPRSSQAPHSARFEVNSFAHGHVENLLSGYCRIEHRTKIIF